MTQSSITSRGLMLALSSPSGAGKTTISSAILKAASNIVMSISVTTRSPRPGEEHGKDYYFVTKNEFHTMVEANDLLEHAHVFDNYYGTPRAHVEKELRAGRIVLFDIDWQGTQQLKSNAGDDVVSIFILPPSLEELEKRLKTRGQDSDEVVQNRMSKAMAEMSHWPEYDYVIVNRKIDQSIAQTMAILTAESLRRSRQKGLEAFVESMHRAV
ncbi:MAG TPA: guanylate kinase [Rhodospirillaceae bacterium]|nr:guanylate kinase [Candidatus Neomarinimicrobiota bacterium]HCX15005.1 guanylate kinase [Rhodospirillaceae bacterium]